MCLLATSGVFNCTLGNIACILQNCHYHPGQLRGILSSVELAVLSACFRLHAPLLAYQRSPSTLLARATHHGFWPGVLKRLRASGPLPAKNGTGATSEEFQFTTQTACAFHEQGLGATCAFVGQIATFVLVEVGLKFGCVLKCTMCCSESGTSSTLPN